MLKDLTPENYKDLFHYFKSQPHRLCYYSLSTLTAWNHHISKPVWAIDEGALITGMSYHNHPEKNFIFLPIANDRLHSPAHLIDIAKKHGVSKYHHVPEDYLTEKNRDDLQQFFSISEEPEAEDYIYKTEDLAELKGKKYSKKRNLINQFKNTVLKTSSVETGPLTINDVPECIELLSNWAAAKDYDIETSDDAASEKTAAENALKNFETLGFRGLQLRIDGKIKAFGIASYLTDNTGGFNFEKADADIKGLYQYFDQQCAKQLFSHVPFINKECDMGNPGLRQAKRSYYPVSTVKSFQLIMK